MYNAQNIRNFVILRYLLGYPLNVLYEKTSNTLSQFLFKVINVRCYHMNNFLNIYLMLILFIFHSINSGCDLTYSIPGKDRLESNS